MSRRDPALLVVLLFWFAEYAVVTTVDHLASATAFLFLPRVFIASAGILVSMALFELRTVFRQDSTAARAVTMFTLALIGTVAHTLLTYVIFRFCAPEMRPELTLPIVLSDLARWVWVYIAEFGMVLSLDLANMAIARERQIAALSKTGHEAQLRALRYQLNPHFLFNTLNSLAALVSRKDNQAAETMIENLADFVRATLSIHPEDEIRLADELALTRQYLAIEEARFPNRLRTSFDVDDGVADAQVPGLILQPLIENAVRHAVAQSRSTIHLQISAHRDGTQLVMQVANDLPASAKATRGFGIGLSNVRDRLQAHYGGQARFDADRQEERFLVAVTLPLRLAA